MNSAIRKLCFKVLAMNDKKKIEKGCVIDKEFRSFSEMDC